MERYVVKKVLGPLKKCPGIFQVLLEPEKNPEEKQLIRNICGPTQTGDLITLLDTNKEEKRMK